MPAAENETPNGNAPVTANDGVGVPVALTMKSAGWPTTKVAIGALVMTGEAIATDPTATPVPERVRVCGEPEAFEGIERIALRAPDCVGLKVTWSAQLPVGATFAQLCVAEKSLAAGIAPIVSAALPTFVSS